MRSVVVLAGLGFPVMATLPVPGVSQAPRVLEKPQVELAEPFTNVGDVRELRDGRVIVVDNGDRAVYVVDFTAGTSTPVGRPGSGPAEYRVPGTLLPVRGDTTLLVDTGNRRLLVIGPDARPAGVLTDAWPLPNGTPGTRLPRGIDDRQRAYLLGRGSGMRQVGDLVQVDSTPVIRVARASAAEDTVGYMHQGPRRIATTTKNGQLASVNITTLPFQREDGWVAFDDGAVAFVSANDYHVAWLLPDGRRVAGPPIPFTPVRITQQDRDARRNASRNPASVENPDDWPEVKPPFPASGVLAGSDGRLWVERYAPATESRTTYDIIDRRGTVVARAVVPNRGRIVGFGPRAIYVVRRDADDLQYLQRFPL